MSTNTVVFDDGGAYERFMGRWSRSVGEVFLGWLAPAKGAHWLDLGCGTGVFTQLVLDTCSPAGVVAVDPAPAQIDYARKRSVDRRAEFRVVDAVALPFPDHTFDIVASALVINFIPDRPRALAEMRRVARPAGCVAGYVWDAAAQRGSAWPLLRAMRQIGLEPAGAPGAAESSAEALQAMFGQAGFEDIAVKAIEVTQTYRDIDDFWRSQTPTFTPHGAVIAGLPVVDRDRLFEAVRAVLPSTPNGAITYSARANAIKALAPA